MKWKVNIPKFKVSEFRGFTSPLPKEGVRALAIVLGVILAIAAVVYAANFFGKKRESAVLPAKSWEEVTATPPATIPTEIPTLTPLMEEEGTPPASPSPTRGVREPIGTPTPAVEGVTGTPVPAQ